MKRILTKVLLAGLGLTLCAATPARAQIKWQLGLGPTFPQGSFGDGFTTGIHGMLGANFGLTRAPLSFRIDGAYHNNKCHTGGCGDVSSHLLTGSADLELNFPGPVSHPYLIGGVTWGRSTLGGSDAPSGGDAETDVGYNLGGGLHFPLGGNRIFVEARYFDVGDASFVPVTFGIRF